MMILKLERTNNQKLMVKVEISMNNKKRKIKMRILEKSWSIFRKRLERRVLKTSKSKKLRKTYHFQAISKLVPELNI